MSCNLLRGAFYFGLFFRFWGVGFWPLEFQDVDVDVEVDVETAQQIIKDDEFVDQEQKSEGVDACGYVLGQFVALYLLGRRFEDLCHALLKPSFAVDDYLVERIDIRDEEDGVAMKF